MLQHLKTVFCQNSPSILSSILQSCKTVMTKYTCVTWK
ncbi:hypothetical protein EBO34_11705 [Alteribacter keqinensis]|uniref:Uncharacterized protein n=1 Tax=Alteribacter keqinensis TaxID=2483800 RepID=A0A3M7TPC0_9BACI|nr:hypothetical protein EBO34_11705 [Alteribacter keqinensis]